MAILALDEMAGMPLNDWRVHKWFKIHNPKAELESEDRYYTVWIDAVKAGQGLGPDGENISPTEVFVLTYDGKTGFPLAEMEMITEIK